MDIDKFKELPLGTSISFFHGMTGWKCAIVSIDKRKQDVTGNGHTPNAAFEKAIKNYLGETE